MNYWTQLTERGIALIEDVCELHGVLTTKRQASWTFGWTSNFSFYYAHHMSTIEGGMICTDDGYIPNIKNAKSHGMVRENGCSFEERKMGEQIPQTKS